METTVTTKNMISIPTAISRQFGIHPGWKLDWKESGNSDEIIVTVIPDRGERGRRLQGKGSYIQTEKDSTAMLAAEREWEG